MCTPTFTAALFTTAKTLQQPEFPSTDEKKRKCGVHIHDGILFSHKKEGSPATTCMQLEDIMLSEGSHLHVEPKKIRLTETGNRLVVTRNREQGFGEIHGGSQSYKLPVIT